MSTREGDALRWHIRLLDIVSIELPLEEVYVEFVLRHPCSSRMYRRQCRRDEMEIYRGGRVKEV